MGISNQTASETGLPSINTVNELLKQRDFLLRLRDVDRLLLQRIAVSINAITYIEQLVQDVAGLFPATTKPCLLWCDKDLTSWHILNFNDWLSPLVDAVGRTRYIPQSVATFVASPSRLYGSEHGLTNRADWVSWYDTLTQYGLDSCDLVSAQDSQGNWLTLCLLSPSFSSKQEESLHKWRIEQVLQSFPSWVEAMSLRQVMDERLQKHTDEDTGLLQPHAFDNAVDMMLRDARRYFQRFAFATVLVCDSAETVELKHFSDTLRATLRDNDLLARLGEHEFVMAMRIAQLDDAVVVAEKITTALFKADPAQVSSVLSGGVSIGISFYPEQANHSRLYLASKAAANAVSEKVGYRLEYYGKFVQNLDEAYDE